RRKCGQSGADSDTYCQHHEQYVLVDTHCFPSRKKAEQVCRDILLDQSHSQLARKDAKYPCSERQHHAFDDQLTRELSASRAQRRANRYFALASSRAHEHQVGNVGARNEQETDDSADDEQYRRPRVTGSEFLERCHYETPVVVRCRRLEREPSLNGCYIARSVGSCCTRSQSPEHHAAVDEVAVQRGAVRNADRSPDGRGRRECVVPA